MKRFIASLIVFIFVFTNCATLENFATEIEQHAIQFTQPELAMTENSEVKTTSYAKKCFMSLDEHMANILSPNADNVAFAIGMLNPINALVTIIGSPLILIFWPLKTLK